MYLLYFGDIPNLVSCAYSTIPIFPPFNSQYFLFTCLCSFFLMLCSIRREHSSRSFAPPKNGYLVWTRGASSVRAIFIELYFRFSTRFSIFIHLYSRFDFHRVVFPILNSIFDFHPLVFSFRFFTVFRFL